MQHLTQSQWLPNWQQRVCLSEPPSIQFGKKPFWGSELPRDTTLHAVVSLISRAVTDLSEACMCQYSFSFLPQDNAGETEDKSVGNCQHSLAVPWRHQACTAHDPHGWDWQACIPGPIPRDPIPPAPLLLGHSWNWTLLSHHCDGRLQHGTSL